MPLLLVCVKNVFCYCINMNVMRHTKRRKPAEGPARLGRPPSGTGGAKVSEYTQLNLRVPPATKALLDALAGMTAMPAWKILEAALDAYVEQLPDDERQLLNGIRRRRARES